MGDIRDRAPSVMVVVAAFSQYDELLDQTPALLEAELGPVALVGPRVEFSETSYYAKSMGDRLSKQIFAFRRLRPFDSLSQIKNWTNSLEATFIGNPRFPASRPLNLDPGTIDAAKFILASSKDHMHRIYLSQGIFAEITLYFQHGQWRAWPWTYPDYRREDIQSFLASARDCFRRLLAEQSNEANDEASAGE